MRLQYVYMYMFRFTAVKRITAFDLSLNTGVSVSTEGTLADQRYPITPA